MNPQDKNNGAKRPPARRKTGVVHVCITMPADVAGAFRAKCEAQDVTVSQRLRQLARQDLAAAA